MQHMRAALVDEIHRVRHQQAAELARLGDAPSLQQQRQITDLAARHRQLFNDLELNMPAPAATDRPATYQLALLQRLQRFSPTFRDTNLRNLAVAGGLAAGIERAIVEDARTVASDKTLGSFRKPGALRELRRTDEAGHQTIEFCGSPLSWMSAFMSPVVACVEAFNTRRTR
jgi:hypothetical protein